ncbi:MAG: hypothetical protein ABSA72_02165 [Nitrososphaerales archaeon]|jgi:hypothetical protein
MILGKGENLLTLSADPNAIAKLDPLFIRLTVDMAHKHGPGQDEALTYEFKKCGAVYLNLRDFDRPFRKELQKEPDTINVRIGKHVWITFFKPEDKEVVLARDTPLPLAGAPPFPGFKEDGYILIGYSPPPPTGDQKKDLYLFVLWMTKFTVTDKGP